MPKTGAWHEGHIMGGYQNPKCPGCLRERRIEAKARAARLGSKP